MDREMRFRKGWLAWAVLGWVTMPPAWAQPGTATPLDAPLRLIQEARTSFAGVQDYMCLFVKRERMGGEMQPEQLIDMRVRNQPFSVYLHWLGPQSLVGQEVCYVAGKNEGRMRVHPKGISGIVGFVSLDPNDPRVLKNSRHTITEAGISNLLERLEQRWQVERGLNKTQVQIAEYEYNKRRCTRVETIHPDNSGKHFQTYRFVIYFDKETHLPIRTESYDWPRSGGNPQGELLESYSYAELRLNVDLADAVFNH